MSLLLIDRGIKLKKNRWRGLAGWALALFSLNDGYSSHDDDEEEEDNKAII